MIHVKNGLIAKAGHFVVSSATEWVNVDTGYFWKRIPQGKKIGRGEHEFLISFNAPMNAITQIASADFIGGLKQLD